MIPTTSKGTIELLTKYTSIEDIIAATSSPLTADRKPTNALNYSDKDSKFETQPSGVNYFCLTFIKNSIAIKAYRIRSSSDGKGYSHLKSWSLYGSNDNTEWTLLDRRKNVNFLNGPYLTHIFKIRHSKGSFSSFLINETDSWWRSEKIMFSEFDVYETNCRELCQQCTCNKSSRFRVVIVLIILLS